MADRDEVIHAPPALVVIPGGPSAGGQRIRLRELPEAPRTAADTWRELSRVWKATRFS